MKMIKYNNCNILTAATVVGKKEADGPLGNCFDLCEYDEYFGQDSFEKAESEMARRCLNILFSKANKTHEQTELILGGDLTSQCTGTSFAVNGTDIPFLGLYGACSTVAESLLCGGVFVDSGKTSNAVCFALSHYCTAERQYRFPLEYGNSRTPDAQNTVTGCGAFYLTSEKTGIKITEATIGRIIDRGISDANNMGAAMAGAAVDTIERYFKMSRYKIDDFDLIITGDLGHEGHSIACELFERKEMIMHGKYEDSGRLIYDAEAQDMHSGGSGCGCLATVLGGYLIPKLQRGEYMRILAVGTGALLNKNSALQSRTIPSIAHAVCIESEA